MTNELQLHQISVSEMDNNCYLLQAGEEGLLVDAADDAPAPVSYTHLTLPTIYSV